ncbi:hypothetical protein NM688_g5585 [Phlebia brevispora]|uniref:Uncharacterized protein n=1 Tax=Phlebia brevispora TaxID=194682 RepID=A0ACC1ST39_9APHY|nr:hypothetical protein NM688_g5585 [Phlebia brevispora]
MPPPKGRNLNPSGLGRAIINKKVKDARRAQESGLYTTDIDSTTRLQSITQERDLDAFLSTATLAGTEFTAERRNVKIINAPSGTQQNPYLLSEEEEKKTLRKHEENKKRLRVPRRPPWTKSMTTTQLDRQEKDAFLDWRRGLAELQDRDNLLLTPFERNIEVWRQLWRVLERSHLIVQIVDARNPLRFRCEDLESYVQDIEGPEGEQDTGKGRRKNLLLINKSDLLTAKQRRQWADYFDSQGIQYAFFSAANATALQEARRDALAAEEARLEAEAHVVDGERQSHEEGEEVDESPESQASVVAPPPDSESDEELYETESDESDADDDHFHDALRLEEDGADAQDPRARVLSVLELEDLFVKAAPDLSNFTDASGQQPTKLVVGLVGYPNVGKSSTINSLIGEKKVSVSSTPGKTKHFQTIQLSPSIVLCDCPGLVFPQFATTKADLVCDGVLPIDQLREHTAPTALVVKRIPKEVLDTIYGLSIKVKSVEEGGSGKITAEDLLIAHAIARGFTRSGQGNPDEARAARYILKDYVNAKLLYCHPPPGVPEDEFNEDTRQLALKRWEGKKRAPTTRVVKGADTFIAPDISTGTTVQGVGAKSQRLDREFFENNGSLSSRPMVQGSARGGQAFTRSRIYPHQNAVADDGTPLGGRRARIAAVLASAGSDIAPGKKHHKKMKRFGAEWSSSPHQPTQRISASTTCAKLYTVHEGRKQVLLLSIDRPLILGRNPSLCSYVIPDATASGVHCKIYAIQSSHGGIMVSCQDVSFNGMSLNGSRVHKTSVLIMDGDIIQIASRKFECVHTFKNPEQKLHVFDPTPPPNGFTKTKYIDSYMLTSYCLGTGSFATVHLGVDLSQASYKQVACKIMKRKKDQKLEKMMKEVRILTALHHPSINRVYDVLHDDSFLYIFLQLCTGGDLFSYIVNHKDPEMRIHEGEAKYIMYQLILGLKYLHDKHISHRDIKPENILLYAPGPFPRIQLADFGLARKRSYEETFNVCGTVSYLPPEGILALENKDLGYVGMPADCWSAGVIMYIMISGHHPFDYGKLDDEESESQIEPLNTWEEKMSLEYIRNDRRVRRRIVREEVEFPRDSWDSLNYARTLCASLLACDPRERATIHEAFKSYWIQSDIDELSSAFVRRVNGEV